MGVDRGVERRREDALVLRHEVVGELVEIADPADHRRRGDDLVAIRRQFTEELGVLGVALDEPVARVVVVGLRQPAVLREVVDADDLVAGLEQLRDEVAADEPGRAGDEDPHARLGVADRAAARGVIRGTVPASPAAGGPLGGSLRAGSAGRGRVLGSPA
jgi:hypothetical protein